MGKNIVFKNYTVREGREMWRRSSSPTVSTFRNILAGCKKSFD